MGAAQSLVVVGIVCLSWEPYGTCVLGLWINIVMMVALADAMAAIVLFLKQGSENPDSKPEEHPEMTRVKSIPVPCLLRIDTRF